MQSCASVTTWGCFMLAIVASQVASVNAVPVLKESYALYLNDPSEQTTQQHGDPNGSKNVVTAEYFWPPPYVRGDEEPPSYRPRAQQRQSVRDQSAKFNQQEAQQSKETQALLDVEWLKAYFYTINVDDYTFFKQMNYFHLSFEPRLAVHSLSFRVIQARKILYSSIVNITTREMETRLVDLLKDLSVESFRLVGYDVVPDVYIKRSWSNGVSTDELSFISTSAAEPADMSQLLLATFNNGYTSLAMELYKHIISLYPFGQRVFEDGANPDSTPLARIEYFAQTVALYGLLQSAVLKGSRALVDMVLSMGQPHPSPTQCTLLVALGIARGHFDALVPILEFIYVNDVELLLPEGVYQNVVSSVTPGVESSIRDAQASILALKPKAFGLPEAFLWHEDQPPLHYLTRDPITDCQRYDCTIILDTLPNSDVRRFTVQRPTTPTDENS